MFLADVAQLVEHHLAKVRVAVSNTVVRSKKTPRFRAPPGVLFRARSGLPIRLPIHCHMSCVAFHVMSGHLRQRGKGWELIAYAGRHPRTGRKTYARKTFHGTRRQATSELNRFIVEVEDGLHQLATGTVGELLDRWIEVKSPDWSPSTTRQQVSIVEHHLKPRFGKLPLRKLRAVDIDGFYASLRKDGGKGGKPLAAATVLRIHVVFHSALRQAVKWGWLNANPAALASPPPARQAEIKPPAPAELSRLLAYVDEVDLELAAFLRVSAFTGARRSQVCGLRWSDIDFEDRTISFVRGVVDGLDGIVVKDTKTHRGYVVAASDDLLAVLRHHRAAMLKRSMACGATESRGVVGLAVHQ